MPVDGSVVKRLHTYATARDRVLAYTPSPFFVNDQALVQIKSRPTPTCREGSFYAAASTAFQTAGVLLSLRRSLPRLNCPL